jgi:hypothetical protein
MTNIYNLFKFIGDKEPEYKFPRWKSEPKLKLIYAPDEVTKEDLHVKDDFETSFYSIADDFDTKDGKGLTSLPDGMIIDRNLYVGKDLKSLPNNLTVRENLKIFDNYNISSLPEDLKVEGNFEVYDSLLSEYTEEELKKMAPGIKGKIFTKWNNQ